MSQRHKVFVSYHHANDQAYRDQFERMFVYHHDIMVSHSVRIGDINEHMQVDRIRQIIRDKYLRDSTVTVVLIGSETWKRKHVDWEIGASLRHTQYSPRSGLIGILLPSYQPPKQGLMQSTGFFNTTNNPDRKYYEKTIPPRLVNNALGDFAKIYDWSSNPNEVQKWIHEAFLTRTKVIPDNSFPNFVNNRSRVEWQR
ncbi:TIR domain-containing protein [Neptunomonas qingdaonensis]|uniref:MTH538 TIR-like domain n=1 Tax=Neptunomonas qingdaonensis TaxID=1045558 RepID=A0A1I2SLT0_9GAMM|nr:TIR domain-containing protein [Neptunomonas qingdaonensis]SFG51857.1 MTH538 TIR-like domain [Neptunomonas qingdaonensis]